MKKHHIRLTIDGELHRRLVAICDHHGDKTDFIRKGIRMIVQFTENHNKEVLDYANGSKGTNRLS